MSKSTRKSRKSLPKNGHNNGLSFGANGSGTTTPTTGEPTTTGRYLVLFREGALESGMRTLTDRLGVQMTSASEFEASAIPADTLAGNDSIVFDTLGIAVVSTLPDQFSALNAVAAEGNDILAIEAERIVYAIDEASSFSLTLPGLSPVNNTEPPANRLLSDYLYGYQTAVNHLVDELLARQGADEQADLAQLLQDEDELTWGLQATNVASSGFTGQGVRVAVLDTGFDFNHPDFIGRRITSRSFIAGQTADDGHGHGTHCIGTACGPQRPGQLPRYGIASDAEIFVGKVLSNAGSGTDAGILAGIEWAVFNQCAVVSMSLGARTVVGQTFSPVFEVAARRALAAGTLIIAAAGNESSRPNVIRPVSHPANCPSILAVAALNAELQIAPFSSGGLNLQGGQVDIAGPGVAVHSSWPRPTLYRSISGTSMATPHVAGIAALYAEANPAMRGGSLGWLLLQSAHRLELPTRDVGAGLVQAP